MKRFISCLMVLVMLVSAGRLLNNSLPAEEELEGLIHALDLRGKAFLLDKNTPLFQIGRYEKSTQGNMEITNTKLTDFPENPCAVYQRAGQLL